MYHSASCSSISNSTVSSISSSEDSGTDIVTQKQSVGFKVKPQGVTVNIPRTVTVTSLTASNIALGITWADVGTTLTNFESRIRVLEGKFGI